MKLNGLKTYLAGGGAVLTGLALVVANLSPFDSSQVVAGILTALGGLAAVGLGHKLDKVKAIFEALAKDEEK